MKKKALKPNEFDEDVVVTENRKLKKEIVRLKKKANRQITFQDIWYAISGIEHTHVLSDLGLRIHERICELEGRDCVFARVQDGAAQNIH